MYRTLLHERAVHFYGKRSCRLLADVHFVNGIGAAAEGVDDEEDVAHIYVDAALEGRVELEVAGERFDIAIEGETDEFALGVEHARAAVAARDVVVGEEAGGQLAVLAGVAAEVAFEVELAQTLVDEIVRFRVAFLLKHTAQHRAPVVEDTVARLHVAHFAVGHAQGEVGVGRLGPVVHLAEAAHVDLLQLGLLGLIGQVVLLLQPELVLAVLVPVLHHRVALQEVGRVGRGKGSLEALLRGEYGMVVHIGIVGLTFGERGDELGHEAFLLVFEEEGQQEFHALAVDADVEMACALLVVGKELCLGFADFRGFATAQGFNHGVDNGRADVERLLFDGVVEEVAVEQDIAYLLAEAVDALNDVLIFGLAALGSKLAEGGFLLTLLAHEVNLADGLVHTAVVLHHIAEAHVVILELQTDRIVGVHLLLEKFEVRIAHEDEGQVLLLRAHLDLRGRQVAARAARETHDHRIVALVETAEADGEELLDVERAVVLVVVGWLSVLVGVDAEEGKVGVVARPHPVVRIAAELRNIERGVDHEAHVRILLFEEEEVLVGAEEGDDAGRHSLGLLELALLQHCFGQGLKERLAHGGVGIGIYLCGSGFHLGRDVGDAAHEGEGEVGRGQFLFATLGEVAVLQVVVLHGAHGVYITEAAVIVGQHETVGTDEFARAAIAKDADTFAQRSAFFVVEGRGGQLETSLAERISQMLLFHQLEQPHAFVSAGSGEAQQESQAEGKEFSHFYCIV